MVHRRLLTADLGIATKLAIKLDQHQPERTFQVWGFSAVHYVVKVRRFSDTGWF